MNLTHQMRLLYHEEAAFFNDRWFINEHGRMLKDIADDMVDLYERTNEHLKTTYPDSAEADNWISVNEFSAMLVKETW